MSERKSSTPVCLRLPDATVQAIDARAGNRSAWIKGLIDRELGVRVDLERTSAASGGSAPGHPVDRDDFFRRREALLRNRKRS